MRVLYLTHRGFVRAGAALVGGARDRLTEVKARLAELGTQFTQNLLADERDWFMELAEAIWTVCRASSSMPPVRRGKKRGKDGPVVTLSRSLIVPFLQFSPRRDLRERRYKAWAARGANGGETDNRAIAAETLACAKNAQSFWAMTASRLQAGNRDGKTPDAVREPADGGVGAGQGAAEADAAC
jgi:peptidyl-dipeptidase Dcp